MSTAAWAGIAVAVMVVGGIAMYAFSGSDTTTASRSQPGIERSMPPATTGQGGAQSRECPPRKKRRSSQPQRWYLKDPRTRGSLFSLMLARTNTATRTRS